MKTSIKYHFLNFCFVLYFNFLFLGFFFGILSFIFSKYTYLYMQVKVFKHPYLQHWSQ